tara:strand:- start:1179 stop:1364 length:186 start_codon:yes stop_codon:yes gene_type:complete
MEDAVPGDLVRNDWTNAVGIVINVKRAKDKRDPGIYYTVLSQGKVETLGKYFFVPEYPYID